MDRVSLFTRTIIVLILSAISSSTLAEAQLCPMLSTQTCALPFPSNTYLVQTPDGPRVEINDNVIADEAYGSLPLTSRPSSIFKDADGYASTTPIIFELTQDVQSESIPSDGGEFVAVYDVDSGRRVPIVIDFDRSASQPGGAENLIYAWARSKFDYGKTLVAIVYGSIATQTGESAALNNQQVMAWAQSSNYNLVVTLIDQAIDQGIGVAGGTVFTVRSEFNTRHQLEDMVATAQAQDHPISDIEVDRNRLNEYGEDVDTVVSGKVRVTDFRNPQTGSIEWYPGFEGYQKDIPFLLSIPKTHAGSNGAPVVIYGHGIGITKERMSIISDSNAKRGVATLSLDQPWHGSEPTEPYIFDLLKPQELEKVIALPYQSVVHHTSLLKALKTSFVGQDWQPWRLFGNHGDGEQDLDPNYVMYQGTSLGGVLGAAFVATNPEISTTMLQVSGVGIMNIISNSMFWNTFDGAAFSNVLPVEASTPESAVMIGMVAHAVDGGDGTNFIKRMRSQNQTLLSIYNHRDPVVYNRSSERLLELLNAPLYGPLQYNVPHLGYIVGDRPANGQGGFQLFGLPDAIGLIALINHIRFINDEDGLEQLDGWLEDRLTEAGY